MSVSELFEIFRIISNYLVVAVCRWPLYSLRVLHTDLGQPVTQGMNVRRRAPLATARNTGRGNGTSTGTSRCDGSKHRNSQRKPAQRRKQRCTPRAALARCTLLGRLCALARPAFATAVATAFETDLPPATAVVLQLC